VKNVFVRNHFVLSTPQRIGYQVFQLLQVFKKIRVTLPRDLCEQLHFTYNYDIIIHVKIIWDENKNRQNIAKHHVSFDEAETVFYDPNAKLISDPDHSDTEDRFVILGLSKMLRMLVVCHCYRENDEIIRIITARKATKKESAFYGGM